MEALRAPLSVLPGLRRWPDLETPELRAWDTADTLMLDEAAPLLPGADVVVIGDTHGALTLGALERGAASVRVHQDAVTGERALDANAQRAGLTGYTHVGLVPEAVAGARVVLLRLPRSLDSLAQAAALVAAHAHPDVVVIAGGRLKHMSMGMNAVLERFFGRVEASLARQKSRLLVAREPLPTEPVPPRRASVEGYEVVAVGGVFAGDALDLGTRELLAVMDGLPSYRTAIDLGCGTGLLAVALARREPGARVVATDQSAVAVESARLTAAANGVTVEVLRDDAGAALPDGVADLVVLNPPFHSGAAVTAEASHRLFEAAARLLRPGGELWCVWNSHLAHTPALRRIVGPTRQVRRTPKFTVTASRRPHTPTTGKERAR